jgi:hypothetical protein
MRSRDLRRLTAFRPRRQRVVSRDAILGMRTLGVVSLLQSLSFCAVTTQFSKDLPSFSRKVNETCTIESINDVHAVDVPVPVDDDLCRPQLHCIFGDFCKSIAVFSASCVQGAVRSAKGLRFRRLLATGCSKYFEAGQVSCEPLCNAAGPPVAKATYEDQLITSAGLADENTCLDVFLRALRRDLDKLVSALTHSMRAHRPRPIGSLMDMSYDVPAHA